MALPNPWGKAKLLDECSPKPALFVPVASLIALCINDESGE
jgi:hypothetical protein